jgi:uncharacterized membrane protein
MKRLLRHLFAVPARRRYPPECLHRIADAIAAGELRHSGEVCFAVESELPLLALLRGVEARTRALEAFALLRAWDTEANNGVLLYLLLADHRIEIVADRGLTGRVTTAQWREVCHMVEQRLHQDDYEGAVVRGIDAISDLLAGHFPQAPGGRDENELPDLPRILR